MNQHSNQKLTANAQRLRKSMTKEERHLWYDFLKTLPVTFYRQKVLGAYIVDFYCARAKVVIELDGSQQYNEPHLAADAKRDEYLSQIGMTVLRYSNRDIAERFNAVCTDILQHI